MRGVRQVVSVRFVTFLLTLPACLDWAPPEGPSNRPTINGIDGTGPASPVEPRPEDEDAWNSYREDARIPADHRIDTRAEEPELIIAGTNLSDATEVQARGQEDQGTMEFDIVEATMERLRVRFRTTAVVAGGLFLLTVTTPAGEAEAQVYFLQGMDGEDGEEGEDGAGLECDGHTCTLRQNLSVEGEVNATRGHFDSLEVESLTVNQSVWLPECPPGYLRDTSCETCDQIILCRRDLLDDGTRFDEMVKVGDFWVDRYEASVWSTPACGEPQYGGEEDNWADVGGDVIDGSFPYHGSFSTPMFACSLSGVTPTRWLTWFRAYSPPTCSSTHWRHKSTRSDCRRYCHCSTRLCHCPRSRRRRRHRVRIRPRSCSRCSRHRCREQCKRSIRRAGPHWSAPGRLPSHRPGHPPRCADTTAGNCHPSWVRERRHWSRQRCRSLRS